MKKRMLSDFRAGEPKPVNVAAHDTLVFLDRVPLCGIDETFIFTDVVQLLQDIASGNLMLVETKQHQQNSDLLQKYQMKYGPLDAPAKETANPEATAPPAADSQ